MLKNVKGSCLCGNIQFEIDSIKPEFGTCHCDHCRKLNAGSTFFLPQISVKKISSDDWEKVAHYVSSDWGRRGFCPKCGTYLYHGRRDKVSVAFSVELFEQIVEQGVFTSQIWCSSKPDYYTYSNNTSMSDFE
ncbi:GFA family protein [Carnobacterium sp.]|uniref:GFA family protein n=1 Tax=Carnobacterium sp. TaxID=48221 RepID=UPI00388DE03E